MMERTAAVLAYEALPDGQRDGRLRGLRQARRSGAAEGASCTVRAKLDRGRRRPQACFDVEVTEGERTIGVGTHQRRVIAVAART